MGCGTYGMWDGWDGGDGWEWEGCDVVAPSPVAAHLVTLSPRHPVTPSPRHPVTPSPCHLVTLSPCHLVTWRLARQGESLENKRVTQTRRNILMQPSRSIITVLLMTLVIATVSFAVVMAFQMVSQSLGDPSTSLVLRWVGGTISIIGLVDAFLLLICLALRSLNESPDSSTTSGRGI